jgi:hypothetical protein
MTIIILLRATIRRVQRGIEEHLIEKARQKFGDARTQELQPDIEKLAADLNDLNRYPLAIEDEL